MSEGNVGLSKGVCGGERTPASFGRLKRSVGETESLLGYEDKFLRQVLVGDSEGDVFLYE